MPYCNNNQREGVRNQCALPLGVCGKVSYPTFNGGQQINTCTDLHLCSNRKSYETSNGSIVEYCPYPD